MKGKMFSQNFFRTNFSKLNEIIFPNAALPLTNSHDVTRVTNGKQLQTKLLFYQERIVITNDRTLFENIRFPQLCD
jgi:hypothetical protein